MIIRIDKKDAIAVARLAALAIRQAVKGGTHMSAIKAANLHLDRFVAAMENGTK